MNKHTRLAALLWALPFLSIVAVDLAVLGRAWYSAPNDNTPGFFGWGYAWYAWAPSPYAHHPAFAFRAVSGLIVALLGLPEDHLVSGYLDAFNNVGAALQILTLLCIAWWVARLFSTLSASPVMVFACAALTASMPTMILFGAVWGNYFITGLLLTPVSLATFVAVKSGHLFGRDLFAAMVGLGFLVANYFPAGIVLAAVLAWFVWAHREEMLRRGPSAFPYRAGSLLQLTARAVTAVLLFVLARNVVRFLDLNTIALAELSVAIAVLTIVLAETLPVVSKLVYGLGCPVLLGWAAGINYFLIDDTWGVLLTRAALHKGGAAEGALAFHQLWGRLDLSAFLLAYPWHLAIPLLLLCAGAAFALYALRSDDRDPSLLFAGVFTAVVVLLNCAVAANITLVADLPPQSYGLHSRYYMVLLSVIPVSLAVVDQLKSMLRYPLYAAFIAISLLSYAQYLHVLGPVVNERALAYRTLDGLIDQHLRDHTEGVVICARVGAPERCAVLYGINTDYATPRSREALGRRSLAAGRIQFRLPADAERSACAPNATGSVLVISERPLPCSNTATVVRYVRALGLYASRRDVTG